MLKRQGSGTEDKKSSKKASTNRHRGAKINTNTNQEKKGKQYKKKVGKGGAIKKIDKR